MASLLTHSMASVPEKLQNWKTLQSAALAPEVVRLVRQQLQSHLEYGYPPITLMADTLEMSVRSFQRLLEKNDLTYTLLVDQVRYEVAVRSLQNPTLNITEIAMNLGFSDSASFCHAFRRWTGLSPRQFRRLILDSPSSLEIWL